MVYRVYSEKKKEFAHEAKALLLEAGLFAFIRQRPFDIVANPQDTPKGIFVTAFSKMPLAQDFSFALKGEEEHLQAGIKALAAIAKVSVGIAPPPAMWEYISIISIPSTRAKLYGLSVQRKSFSLAG